MFAFLRGVVAGKPAESIHLDVGGVGYEIFVPDSVRRKLVVDGPVTLLTHCHIREDAFLIFGFLREEERSLFRMLLSVSGVGPKVALAILSVLSPAQFGKAIRDSDVTAFTKVTGVGKKTAQRLVLELKTKLGQDAELSVILGEDGPLEDDGTDDVIAALVSLGCTLAEAQKVAAKARKVAAKDASDEEIVRVALKSMAKV